MNNLSIKPTDTHFDSTNSRSGNNLMLKTTETMSLTANTLMNIDSKIEDYQTWSNGAFAGTQFMTPMASVLVVFDSRVQDLGILHDALVEGALGYTIDAQEDALAVITQLLTQTGARRLAIVAHGESGVVQIGALPLHREQLKVRSHLLQEWGVEEIALYSCEVGKDINFVAQLERLTGARVAAAKGKVGAAAKGGSWELDVKSVDCEVNLPLTVDGLAKYPGVLATVNATSGNDNFDGTGATNSTTNTSSGNDTINVTDPNQINSGDTFNGGGGTDTIALSGNGTFDFTNGATISNVENLTGGNSAQTVNLTSAQINALSSIDLGTGNDTLQIQNSATVDLSSKTLANIENISVVNGTTSSNESLTLSQSQYTDATLTSIFLGNGTDSLTIKTSGNFTLDSTKINANVENIILDGDATAQTITGSARNETIRGNGGNDTIDGGAGTDTVVFSGNRTDYTISLSGSTYTVVDNRSGSPNGTDTVTNVENFQFADGTLATGALDITAPTVSSVAYGSNDGTLKAGETVTLVVNFSENVTVAGGTPTLTLNSGGTATYTSGSGTNALTFTYNVNTGQTSSDLAVTAFNLNGATVKDTQGNFATLTGAVTNPNGTLVVDTTAPTVAITDNVPGTANLATNSIAYTYTFSEAVTGLATNDFTVTNGTISSITGSGTTWTVNVTPAANVASGNISLVLANAAVTDAAGNLNVTVTNNTQAIDTLAPNAPTISTVTDNVGSIQGSIANSGQTDDTTPTFAISLSGTNAVAGDSVRLFNGATQIASYTLTAADITANSVSITPSALALGNYSITASITDAAGNQSAASAVRTFTIAAVNSAPVLTGTAATLTAGTEDTTYTITAASLLQGFTDANGDTMSVANLTATNGTLVNNNGTYSFTPNANFNGTVNLTYNVTDGQGGSTAATQSFTLAAVNDPVTGSPTATLAAGTEDQSYTVTATQLLQGFTDVDIATNGQSLSVSGLTASNGIVTNNGDGTYTIAPTGNFNGNVTLTYSVSDGNGSTLTGQTRTYSVAAVNDAPVVANAIPTQNGTEDTLVNFTIPANTFTDVDAGDTLTLSASLANGDPLPTWLSFNAATQTFSGTPPQDFNGTLSLKVTATDSGSLSTSSSFDLVVAGVNDAPVVANAIPTQNGTEDTLVNFTIPANTFTDVDDASLTLSATLGNGDPLPTWLSFNAATQTFSGTPPQDFNGTLSLKVTATDSGSLSTSSSFDLVIAGVNDAPVVANAIPTQNGTEDTLVNFTIPANTFTDVDAGDTLTLSATLGNGDPLPTWLSFNAATQTFSGTPPQDFNGTLSLKVTATDAGSLSTSSSFNLVIAGVNDAPVVANAIPTQNGTEDTAVNFTIPANTFTDVDDASLTLSASLANGDPLPTWLSFNAATQTFSGTPPQDFNGTLSLKVTATDSGSLSTTSTFDLIIAGVNDAPVLVNAIPTQNGTEDTAVNFTIPANTFTDVDDASLTLSASLANGDPLPTWLSFNAATQTFSGTPPQDFNGTLSLKVTATDSGSLSTASSFNLVIAGVNDAPVVANAIPTQNGTEDTAVNFTIPANTFSDVDDASLTLSATLGNGDPLPTWLSFNANTGSFSGTPPQDFNGTLSLKVTATDSGSLSTSSSFNLVIAGVNDAPVVANAIPTQNGTEDTLVNFTIPANTFSDVDAGDTLTLSATLGNGDPLPTWLSFNAATQTFSGTPPQDFNGTLSLKVTATDSGSLSTSSSFDLVIAGVNDAPVVANPLATQNGTEDTAVNFTIPANTFTDVDDASLTLSATLGNGDPLPTWLSFNAATQTFSGTPPQDFNGTLSLKVTATDSGSLSTSSSFDLVIAGVNDAPVVANAIPTQNGTEDTLVNFTIPANTFTDVDDASLTLSASLANGDPLPTWLSFNAATQTFSGTPPQDFNGTLSLKVTATDSGSLSTSSSFNLVIAGVNDAPVVANAIPTQNGTEDTLVNFTIPANTFTDVDAGDTLTLSATLGNGDPLPTWLSFNAATQTFSGTPPQDFNGTLSLKVTATDSGSLSTTSTFDLIIAGVNDAPVLVNAIPTQNGTEDTLVNFTIPANTFTDVDDASLTLSATLGNGDPLPTWLSFNAATQTFSGTPPQDFNGTLSLKVTATDSGSLSTASSFNLVVAGVNDAPVVANAIPTQNGTEDTLVNFTIPANTFTDVDDASLTLSASLANGDPLPTWLSFNAATQTFSGTPPQDFNGTLSLKVTATDSGSLSTSSSFNLVIAGVNDAPVVANAIPTQNGTEDTLVNFTIPANTFTDVDAGDTLTLSATLGNGDPLPTWLSFNAATQTFSGTPPQDFNGTLSLKVTATDSGSLSTASSFNLVVAGVNDAPVVANAIPTQNGTEDTAVNFTIPANTFTDVDDASLTLSASLANGDPLPTWLSFNAATQTFSGTPPQDFNGTLSLKVTATDSGSLSTSSSFNLVIAGVNDAPVVANAIPTQNGTEDTLVNFTIPANTFSDVDDASLTLSASLANGDPLPTWLSFNAATQTFSGTPPQDFNGTLSLKVTATDSGSLSTASSFNLVVAGVNDAAVITGISLGSVTEAGSLNIGSPTATGDLNSTDVDNPNDSWTAVANPTSSNAGYGTYILSANGVWTYNLDNNNSAVQALNDGETLADTFVVRTVDGTAKTVTITINGASDAPVDTTPPTVTISSTKTSFKAGESAIITFSFSEVPAGFTSSDINVTGGTITNVTVNANDPTIYTATFIPTANTNSLSGAISIAAGTFTDAAGNNNLASTPLAITGDTLAPTAPAITAIGGADSTVSSATGDAQVVGTAEANSTVTVKFGSTLLGTATTGSDGNWTYGLTSANITTLAQGSSKTITATATDAAGNTSPSASGTFTVDTVAPNAPSITNVTDNFGSAQGSVANPGSTDDNTPTFAVRLVGTNAVAGDTVRLFNGTTQIASYILAGADITAGTISITPTTLTDGIYNITAHITDIAGNQSTASAARSLTIDTTPPAAPSISQVNDNVGTIQGDVTNGSRTNDTTPTFVLDLTGTNAVTGNTIRLFNGLTQILSYTLTATDIANNSASITTGNLAQGSYSITARITDGTGNQSAASTARTFTIDTAATSAPSISTISDNVGSIQGLVANSGRTDDTTPTFTMNLAGTGALVGDTVKLFNGATEIASYVLTTNEINASSVSITPTLTQGSYSITARIIDVAGNQSAASSTRTFTIDTTPAAAPSITSVNDNVGTIQGNVVNGGLTNDTTPTFALNLTGTNAVVGDTVRLFNGETQIASYALTGTDINNNSASITTGVLAQGSYSITARITDVAGNQSADSSLRTFTIDTAAPVAPTITGFNNASGTTLTLTGTAEAGSTVAIRNGNTTLGTAVAGNNGSWSYGATSLTGNTFNITANATDTAGNTSPLSAASNIIAGSTANNTLNGTSANNVMVGYAGNDTLNAGAGNDTLLGGDGNDTLLGGDGNDILVGGSGDDILTGGAGNDKFAYQAFTDRGILGDTITDFNTSQDQLMLTDLLRSVNYSGINPITDGYLRFNQSGTSTQVQIDQDGLTGGSNFSTLATLNNITATNLVIGTNVLI